MTEKAKVTPLQFAERHLSPFHMTGPEIIPDLCPVCKGGGSEDRGTFAMNRYTGAWNCKRGNCAAEGNFQQLADMFDEDGEVLNPQSYSTASKKTYLPPATQLMPVTDDIISYFERRKIGKDTLAAFKIASDTNGNIVFPFYRKGELVFVKMRPSRKVEKGEKKEWREKNTEPILFGMDNCAFGSQLVITEGQVDAMSLYEAGIHNVVSVPSGCEDMEWVNLCWDWLEKFEDILIFGDADEPGQSMVQKLIKMLGEARCSAITEYPVRPVDNDVPCKDANEILYFYGADKLIEMVQEAPRVEIKGIMRLADVKRVDYTTLPRIRSGIPKLDELTGGMFDGCVTVITGEPGGGKSTLTGTLMLNAIEQGHSVFAYSGELPKEKFLQWIILQAAGSEYIGLKEDRYRGAHVPHVANDASAAITEWFYDKFFLADNAEIISESEADAIIHLCEQAARRYGCHLFLIDNAMTAVADSSDERLAQIKLIKSIKKFAMRYDAHVILVAHPRKIGAGQQIQGSDISGAKEFYNLADTLFTVEKPDIRIIKNRDAGINAIIECVYCPDSRRIYQADVGDIYNYSWKTQDVFIPSPMACTLAEYKPRIKIRDPI